MRTIKFRGKRIDNKEWVYGYLYKLPLPSGEACMILTQDNNHLDNHLEPKYHLAFTLWVDLFVIDPATVGQFTGLTDKYGNEIYEGDILLYNGIRRTVEWKYGTFGLSMHKNGFPFQAFYELPVPIVDSTVVGNVHDNPELMKGGKDA